jgi:hypothetical protein
MTTDARAAVKVLLDTANISVSDEELENFTESYPLLRAQADGLYMPHLDAEDPAISFDPTVDSAAR